MIREYIVDLAEQSNIKLLGVTIIEGSKLSCRDAHMVFLSAKRCIVNALVYQSDLDNLQYGNCSDRLELSISSALSRLQLLQKTNVVNK
jgi:hypothetical protein